MDDLWVEILAEAGFDELRIVVIAPRKWGYSATPQSPPLRTNSSDNFSLA